jgi:dipeptidyl aminopeptidase/acylaminoacyl peptidase
MSSFLFLACDNKAPPKAEPPKAEPPPAAKAVAATAPAERAAVAVNPSERTAEAKARDDARAPIANALLNAYTNSGPRLSPDRKKVLFTSRRDGNRELYLGDVANPSSQPIAITHGPERATFGAFTRDGKSILFLRDTGADENFRIYEVGLDGKNETCLTPGPVRHRSEPFEAKDAQGTLVYGQRDVKTRASEFVVQKLGGEPKVVYTDPGPASVADLAPDGKRALLVHESSQSDQIVYELELASGKTRRLYPPEGKTVTVNDISYSADGKHAYLAADDGAEGQFLYAIDVASAAITAQYRQMDPPTASVGRVAVSPHGDRLAITIDAGDHSEARILDAKTLEVTAKVTSPLGAILLSPFSDDGVKLPATITTADAPTDVFSIDAKTGAVEPLRKDARPGLDKLAPIESSVEQVKAFDGLSIPVIVYLPKGAKTSGKRLPVIVEFHGGPASSSSVGWDIFARFFCSLGYAFIEPNVRGSTGYGRAYEMADNREKRADWLKDLESINAWAKAQPWADASRIVAMGSSYGGYTVLMALTRQPALWRAGVDYVGIANLMTLLKSTDQLTRAVFVDEFGDLDKDKALLDEFSPLRDKAKITAPLYVYAGQNDPQVPRAEADQIVLALRERGIPVEYQVAANEGHSLDHQENRVELMTRVARFLEDNLK